MVSVYGSVVPSLRSSNIVWETQRSQPFSFNQHVVVTANVQYNIQTLVVSTAIMEWNIGVPIIGQIRQTAQDRTDFAY